MRQFDFSRVFLPDSTARYGYAFPESDADLPESIRAELKNHPVRYWPKGQEHERYNRCPTCEEWSPCTRRQALVGSIDSVNKGTNGTRKD